MNSWILRIQTVLSFFLLAVAIAAPTVSSAQLSVPKPQSRADLMVFMKSEANLRQHELILNRELRHRSMHRSLVQHAEQSQASIWNFLNTRGYQYRPHYLVNMLVVENADPQLMKELSQRPDVRKVVVDRAFQARGLPLPSRSPKQIKTRAIEPNILAVHADQVWAELKIGGQGIVVGGQDTGLQWNHPALARQYRGNTGRGVNHDYNWRDAIRKPLHAGRNKCGYASKIPCDDHGHGTHTMGTVLGDDGGANKIGMAPVARWIGCRNMDSGVGTTASYMDCFEFFFAPYPVDGNPLRDGQPSLAPHVINNSWGCPTSEGCQGDEFIPVMKKLTQAGIMLVVSAGNDGSGCGSIQMAPAYNTELTFTVGASNNTGSIASFSSRGPSTFDKGVGPDVVAPGVGIRSSFPGNRYADGWDGTSMSGPHVAGLVALMWSANKNLIGKIPETSDLIRKTSTPIKVKQSCGGVSGETIPNNTAGYGMIDAYRAVKAVVR
jgi:serine protease AprX